MVRRMLHQRFSVLKTYSLKINKMTSYSDFRINTPIIKYIKIIF